MTYRFKKKLTCNNILVIYYILLIKIKPQTSPAMRKILPIFTVLCCLLFNQALSQDTLSVAPQEIAMSILKKLDHEISLADGQMEDVYALLVERSEEFARARQRGGSKAEALYSKANESTVAKLKKILTEGQYDKFTSLRQEAKKQKDIYPRVGQSGQDVELDF